MQTLPVQLFCPVVLPAYVQQNGQAGLQFGHHSVPRLSLRLIFGGALPVLGGRKAGAQPVYAADQGGRGEGLDNRQGQPRSRCRVALPLFQQSDGSRFDFRLPGVEALPVLWRARIEIFQPALPVGGMGQAGSARCGRVGAQAVGGVGAQQVMHPPFVGFDLFQQAGIGQTAGGSTGIRFSGLPHVGQCGQVKLTAGKNTQTAQTVAVGGSRSSKRRFQSA